jgi:predicted kinase
MLIAFGGLPGAGKTTLAKALAKWRAAAYLRIDAIEQAVRDSQVLKADIGPAGYSAAYRLAEENLLLGNTVVADSVNALRVTRDAWSRRALPSL